MAQAAADAPPIEQRMATFLVRLAAVATAVVVVTGVPLIWTYRPNHTGGLRTLHLLGSTLLVGSGSALLLVTAWAALARHSRTWAGWVVAVGGFAAAALGSISGARLAWEQVDLRGVTTGTGVRGALKPLSGGVRSVVVGGSEIAPATYGLWLAAHLLIVPLALAAVGWLAWRRAAARQPGG